MEASRAKKDGLVVSSLRSQEWRNEGSCGKGQSGCRYVKKSSMSSFMVAGAQMASAESTVDCDDCG